MAIPWTFLRYPVVASTNDLAKAAGRLGCPGYTVFIADEQTKGRGRRGHSWVSPPGGLWMSILFRPVSGPETWPLFTIATGLGVCKYVRSLSAKAFLKWPNDVLVDGKKVCGILCESVLPAAAPGFVVAGIGLNLNVESRRLPEEVQQSAGSLCELLGAQFDPVEAAKRIADSVNEQISLLEEGNTHHVIDGWRAHSDMLGRRVRVSGPSGIIHGVAEDIDENGCLLLRTDSTVEIIIAADVSLRLDDDSETGGML